MARAELNFKRTDPRASPRDPPDAHYCELAIPTIGALSGAPPMEPSNSASPKANIPPSDATILYPAPSGVPAIPSIGSFNA